MEALRQARRHKIPYFGICLGMQLFVIDHCRTVVGWKDAHSTEFDKDTDRPVVEHLSSYGEELVQQLGGTMRLGGQDMVIRNAANSITWAAYTAPEYQDEHSVSQTSRELKVRERHRHRYEVSRWFMEHHYHGEGDCWGGTGLCIAAFSDNNLQIPEMVENDIDKGVKGWWAIGCQFHPELLSRNDRPHPLFLAFLKAKSPLI
jgi:CTP synthase